MFYMELSITCGEHCTSFQNISQNFFDFPNFTEYLRQIGMKNYQ